jgi:hydrogenase maturation protein HypF
MVESMVGAKIWVRGIVQGVGFRPFIYSLAIQNQITGWVRNTSAGVEMEINGPKTGIETLISTLRTSPPPLARIDQIETEECTPANFQTFEIIASVPNPDDFIPISPDMTICDDCARELFTPSDRRYRYPFINCTNCGPRFTIIQDIPYDRPKTTMSGFPMCPDCEAEYRNPLDRRFHAQPVACPTCGPEIWFQSKGVRVANGDNALQLAREQLADGAILAVKGLGGFHLACDASNAAAVDELRSRKKRSEKPFALMAFDVETVKRHCFVTPAEETLLCSRQRPIVLLERRSDSSVCTQVAPNQHTMGVMLAYTPLHLLLLEPATGFPEMLVMTSGNLSEEPIAYEDSDAVQRLEPLADAFLLHNRPIFMRVDDSVTRVCNSKPAITRRSRGYAPDSIQLPVNAPRIFAAGSELKNTFCLTRDRYAFLSHHIGDLENYETLQSFEEGIAHYERLFRIHPEVVACDLHPDYLATRYARARAENENLPLVEVQHHHAHLAACLADNDWNRDEPIIGLSFDGTGLGTDGTIWGGEVLTGGYSDYERPFHLAYVPLPGGDAAVRKPARTALSYLWQSGMDWEPEFPCVETFCAEERNAIKVQLEKHLNAPLTSSMGRLFDAVSSILGVCQKATYEGQAAIELEAIADPQENGWYEFGLNGDQIDPSPMLARLLSDWRSGLPVSILAARFHNSAAQLCVDVCQNLQTKNGLRTVALSGGVWQNRFLLERTVRLLESARFQVLVHKRVPTNDGGLALGQAMIAATQMGSR